MPVYFQGHVSGFAERQPASGVRLREALWRRLCGSNNYLGTDMERALEVTACAESQPDLLVTLHEERANRDLAYRFDGMTGRVRPA